MIFYKSVSVPTENAAGWQVTERDKFGGQVRNVFLHFVSGTGPVEVSFTGQALHGEIGGAKPDDLKIEGMPVSEVWLRSANGDEVVQVWAWGD